MAKVSSVGVPEKSHGDTVCSKQKVSLSYRQLPAVAHAPNQNLGSVLSSEPNCCHSFGQSRLWKYWRKLLSSLPSPRCPTFLSPSLCRWSTLSYVITLWNTLSTIQDSPPGSVHSFTRLYAGWLCTSHCPHSTVKMWYWTGSRGTVKKKKNTKNPMR